MTTSSLNQFGGSWTVQKLTILEGYLKAYTTALKQQNFSLVYVDAFAGTGYIDIDATDAGQSSPSLIGDLDDDAVSILKGSARLALDVDDRPFDHFCSLSKIRNTPGNYGN